MHCLALQDKQYSFHTLLRLQKLSVVCLSWTKMCRASISTNGMSAQYMYSTSIFGGWTLNKRVGWQRSDVIPVELSTRWVYSFCCYSGSPRCRTTVPALPSSSWEPSWICGKTGRPLRNWRSSEWLPSLTHKALRWRRKWVPSCTSSALYSRKKGLRLCSMKLFGPFYIRNRSQRSHTNADCCNNRACLDCCRINSCGGCVCVDIFIRILPLSTRNIY